MKRRFAFSEFDGDRLEQFFLFVGQDGLNGIHVAC